MKIYDYLKKLNNIDKLLYLLYICSSVLYLSLLIPFHPYPFSFALKSIPMLSLFLIVIRNIRTTYGVLFSVGILFCMGGDIILDIDRSRFFIPGLLFFLLGHIFYIAVFLMLFQFNKTGIAYVLPVIIVSMILGVLFFSIPLTQRIPVLIYLFAISTMTILSSFTKFSTKLAFWGAVLFMVSDIIIAINTFFHPIPHSTIYNIGIYFIAQLLITTALVFTFKK